MSIKIDYPDERELTDEQVWSMFFVALAQGKIKERYHEPETTSNAAHALEQAGIIHRS